MCLKLPLRVNFNVRVLCKWRGRYIEAETPRGTCTYVDESCIRGHHVSKDLHVHTWTRAAFVDTMCQKIYMYIHGPELHL